MICDEACENIGFEVGNPFFAMVVDEYVSQALSTGDVFNWVQHDPFSLSPPLRVWYAFRRRRGGACAGAAGTSARKTNCLMPASLDDARPYRPAIPVPQSQDLAGRPAAA